MVLGGQILEKFSYILKSFMFSVEKFMSFSSLYCEYQGFPGGSEVKVSACNAGDLGLIPGL